MKRLESVKLKLMALPVLGFTVLSLPGTASAASAIACVKNKEGFLYFPTWYKYLDPTFENGECKLAFSFPEDISKILLAVVEILLRVGILAAVAFIVYGGFQYLISQGEPDKTVNARKTILNAVIGLVIATFATTIVNFIGSRLLT